MSHTQISIKKIISFLAEIKQECTKQKSVKQIPIPISDRSFQLSAYLVEYNRDGYHDDIVDQWGHS